MVLVVALLATGCGGGDGSSAPSTRAKTARSANAGHVAPELEARLPSELSGVPLARASTTGAAVFRRFGDAAWSRAMARFLARVGKKPADLLYAQVWDPSGKVAFDAGAFRLDGVGARRLRKAVVASSRPGAPGLRVAGATLAGRPVTSVGYPSGATLYLYERDDVVFYAGAGSKKLAADLVATFG